MVDERYSDHVRALEQPLRLRPQARSAAHATLLSGVSAVEAYSKVFATEDGAARLRGRTPFALDRDRILYSDAFRRQDEKFHVLFFGKTRRSRNYTSHAVRAAHLARTIAVRLRLNADLAEAIALGSKVGSVPFIHKGKEAVPAWINKQLTLIDDRSGGERQGRAEVLDFPGWIDPDSRSTDSHAVPRWLGEIASPTVANDARSAFPWAYGSVDSPLYWSYGAGQQSYWILATNPFLSSIRSTSAETSYSAQVLYGIWRHSLPRAKEGLPPFLHAVELADGTRNRLSEDDATYEAAVARYADDIAWVIENLNEASRVEQLDSSSGNTAFRRFSEHITGDEAESIQIPIPVIGAFSRNDAGRIYSYFIDDLVRTATANLDDENLAPAKATEDAMGKVIRLSDSARLVLDKMKTFLKDEIFDNPAVLYRNSAVVAITNTALDTLYTSWEQALTVRIDRIGRVEGWIDKHAREVEQRLADPVSRVQACVSLLAYMSDREIFDLVGLD